MVSLPVILGVGRLTAQKAFDVLIEAFAQVRKSQRVRLLILGEGEERPMLEALIKRLGLEQDIAIARVSFPIHILIWHMPVFLYFHHDGKVCQLSSWKRCRWEHRSSPQIAPADHGKF